MGILQRGLSFVPTASFNLFHWTKDLHLFARKLRWHKYHCLRERRECNELGIPDNILQDVRLSFGLADNNNEQGLGPFTELKTKNRKMPPLEDISCIDVFLDLVLRDLEHINED